ncbi:MAG: hypothetical protein WD342_15405 [Verrucomicrobiales bacterium]
MKLPASLVAEGWIDFKQLAPETKEYYDGLWALEILLDAIDRDPSYAWEILENILIIDRGGRWNDDVALDVLAELLNDHPAYSLKKLEASIPSNGALEKIAGSLNKHDLDPESFAKVSAVLMITGNQ